LCCTHPSIMMFQTSSTSVAASLWMQVQIPLLLHLLDPYSIPMSCFRCALNYCILSYCSCVLLSGTGVFSLSLSLCLLLCCQHCLGFHYVACNVSCLLANLFFLHGSRFVHILGYILHLFCECVSPCPYECCVFGVIPLECDAVQLSVAQGL
jgi:hypothetical protein